MFYLLISSLGLALYLHPQAVISKEFFAFCLSRLLAQVHDMETAFDGFWEKHQLKMEQYLQLWKFEQDFQEVS